MTPRAFARRDEIELRTIGLLRVGWRLAVRAQRIAMMRGPMLREPVDHGLPDGAHEIDHRGIQNEENDNQTDRKTHLLGAGCYFRDGRYRIFLDDPEHGTNFFFHGYRLLR
jgi:hypothetical protein